MPKAHKIYQMRPAGALFAQHTNPSPLPHPQSLWAQADAADWTPAQEARS